MSRGTSGRDQTARSVSSRSRRTVSIRRTRDDFAASLLPELKSPAATQASDQGCNS
uniref:Uncharacterized protein n=1 Tax=Arundo donax TaxID=35708 RepID=A0A0A9FF00_ARUDO